MCVEVMAFTADHLARLKEKLAKCEASQSGRPLDKVGVILDYPEAKGLVERLEMAETALNNAPLREGGVLSPEDVMAWLLTK